MAVRRNLIANFAGSAWTGIVSLIFIPVYLRAVGAEGYGLIGFFVTLSAVMAVFDGGFGPAAARELAQVATQSAAEVARVRNLIRTLEWVFWFVAALMGAGLALSADLIAMHWLNLDAAHEAESVHALRLMGVALALQWPVAYYSGCIISLQRQLGLNFINAGFGTLRAAGAAAVLTYGTPTITAFFAWQAITSLLQVLALQIYLWRGMPGTGPASFVLASAKGIRRFALGIAGINILGLLLTQIDKIVLSKILPLEQFGYYALAATLASLIGRIVMPVFNACYPRITALSATADPAPLIAFYRTACELMAFAVVPVSLLLVVFGEQIVMFWTGDAATASRLRWVVGFLAAGTLLNGLMTIPYALQLAHGWTALALWQNVIAVSVIGPFVWLLAQTFGLPGAAAVWMAVNLGYVLLSAPVMYSKLLPAEKHRWYLHAVAIPIAATLAVLVPIRLIWARLADEHTSRIALFIVLAVAGIAAQSTLALLFRRSSRSQLAPAPSPF